MRKLVLFLLIPSGLAFPPQALHAQTSIKDSLRRVLAHAKEDTGKVAALNALAWEMRSSKVDSSILLDMQALALAQKLGYDFRVARSENELGAFYRIKSEYPRALEHLQRSLEIYTRLLEQDTTSAKIRRGLSTTLGNMGLVYKDQADYSTALDCFFRALRQAVRVGDKVGIARQYGNLGNVYTKQGDQEKALQYFTLAYQTAQEAGSTYDVAIWLGSIANVYMEKGDYEKALGYNLQVYQAFEQMHSWNNMAALLGNIGIIYASLGDRVPPGPGQDSLYQKALASYSKALDMQRELGDPNATAVQLNNLGTLYTVLKQYGKARAFLEEGLELYTRIGSYDGVRDNEKSLSMLDSAQGDYKSALEHYKRYIAARDSISSEENIKKQTETELRYEFSQKEAQGKAEQDKKDTVTRIVLYSTAGGFVLVLLLAVFIFRSYRQKRRANVIITRQKEEVEQQKLLVEEQQKRVLDSIHYAKRIQRSLLPTEKYIERSLHNLK